jgi:CRISPR-associated protein Cas5d
MSLTSFVVWGPLACFARPETPDRFTYPFPTPSAVQGIISSIYDHPGLWADVRRIHVLRPIRMMRLGLVQASDIPQIKPGGALRLASPDRRPTVQTILRDGAWRIDFEWTTDPRATEVHGTSDKSHDIFTRRVERGQFYYPPSLGLHDYRALVRPVTTEDHPIQQSRDFGQVLHGFDRRKRYPKPLVFHAVMRNGIVEVPSLRERLLSLVWKETA